MVCSVLLHSNWLLGRKAPKNQGGQNNCNVRNQTRSDSVVDPIKIVMLSSYAFYICRSKWQGTLWKYETLFIEVKKRIHTRINAEIGFHVIGSL